MTKINTALSNDQLYEAYSIIAKVVALYGDAYMPIFQRLHAEVQTIKKSQDIKTVALNLASLYNVPNGKD